MPDIVNAYSAIQAASPLKLQKITRRDPGPKDVVLEIKYCGVCHSDIHQARNEWHNTVYPCVPGHEITGIVTKTGKSVSKFKKGDKVGVGCLVDSCRKCSACKENLEQHCENGPVFTYNGPEKQTNGTTTYGGYSKSIVVDEDFVLSLPDNLDLAAAAPLLCAGITTYSPLKRFGVTKGQKIGILGLGGLGHMGVKFARALGAHVYVFTRSANKTADAKQLGAEGIILSTDENQMNKHINSFDLILNTVAVKHDINAYMNLIKRSGIMVTVGAPEEPLPLATFSLIMQRRKIAGSLIGGIKETQEMLNFCGRHNITCDIEMININQINEAYERILKSDVKYRFVIDMSTLN